MSMPSSSMGASLSPPGLWILLFTEIMLMKIITDSFFLGEIISGYKQISGFEN